MMNKNKRLLLIGNVPPPYSGQSIAFNMIYEAAKETGEKFYLLNYIEKTKNPSKLSRVIDYLKIFLVYIPYLFGRKKIVYLIIAGARFGFLRDYIFINLAKLFGHKVIAHSHNGYYGEFYAKETLFLQKIIRNTLNKLDKLIVLGERLIEQYSFAELLQPNIVVVPNGLPWQINPDEQLVKNIPSDNKAIKILFLSNLIEAKGYLDLLEAVNLLVNKYNVNIQCTFAGKFWLNSKQDEKITSVEQAQNYFDEYIKQHHLESHARYVGVVSGETKVQHIRESHFFALPTYYYIEAQPLSIIETMAYGVVPISTNYRVIPRLITNEENGFFVDPNSSQSIVNVILKCIENPKLYRRMSKASINKVNTEFSKKQHIESIFSIFNQL